MESREEATSSETLNHQIPQQHDNVNSDPTIIETDESVLSSSSSSSSSSSPISQSEILKAVEIVERDSLAIADSFQSLFSSLRLSLSQVTSRSVDHVQCFSDAAGRLQESALDSTTKGNLYINSCLRLNEEMRGIETLAMQLKTLRRTVDALDTAVNSLVRLP